MCSQPVMSHSVRTAFLHTTAWQKKHKIFQFHTPIRYSCLGMRLLTCEYVYMYCEIFSPSSIFHLMSKEKFTRFLNLWTCSSRETQRTSTTEDTVPQPLLPILIASSYTCQCLETKPSPICEAHSPTPASIQQ